MVPTLQLAWYAQIKEVHPQLQVAHLKAQVPPPVQENISPANSNVARSVPAQTPPMVE